MSVHETDQEEGLQISDFEDDVQWCLGSLGNRGEMDGKQLQEAIDTVNEMYSVYRVELGRTKFEHAMKIGNYILNRFWDIEVQPLRFNHPDKEFSYRAFVKYKGLKMDHSTLSRMVGVAIQEKYFEIDKKCYEAEGIDTSRFSYEHKTILITWEGTKTYKVAMMKQCQEEGWSSRKLREKVKEKKAELNGSSNKSSSHVRTVFKSNIRPFRTFLEGKNRIDLLGIELQEDDFKKLNYKDISTYRSTIDVILPRLQMATEKIEVYSELLEKREKEIRLKNERKPRRKKTAVVTPQQSNS